MKFVKSLKSTVAFSVAQHLICQKANLVVLFQPAPACTSSQFLDFLEILAFIHCFGFAFK